MADNIVILIEFGQNGGNSSLLESRYILSPEKSIKKRTEWQKLISIFAFLFLCRFLVRL